MQGIEQVFSIPVRSPSLFLPNLHEYPVRELKQTDWFLDSLEMIGTKSCSHEELSWCPSFTITACHPDRKALAPSETRTQVSAPAGCRGLVDAAEKVLLLLPEAPDVFFLCFGSGRKCLQFDRCLIYRSIEISSLSLNHRNVKRTPDKTPQFAE